MRPWLVLLVGVIFVNPLPAFGSEETNPTSVTIPVPQTPEAVDSNLLIQLDRPIHFLNPEGKDLVVEDGTYHITLESNGQLRLNSDGLFEPILIQGTVTRYEFEVPESQAVLVSAEENEDEWHLIFLSPDGRAIDASGSVSGTRSRGAISLFQSTARIQQAVSQSIASPPPAPPPTTPAPPPPTPSPKGFENPSHLYAVTSNGTLKWYRHNAAQTGGGLEAAGAWTGPTDVASGWQTFTHIIPGGGNVIYGITPDGTLKWHGHEDFQNGQPIWKGPNNVGTRWHQFKHVFAGSEGTLYAIAQDGTLQWYRHTGYQDGAPTWEGPKNVGTGWQNFKKVVGGGEGIIYAIGTDGTLIWYRHTGYQNGTTAWHGPKNVGTGWQQFKEVFSAGNGIIYAISNDGILRWYRHTGYREGTVSWASIKNVGSGWQSFTRVLSLLPSEETVSATVAGEPVGAVTWGYLRMNAPDTVVGLIQEVQAGRMNATVLQGLAGQDRLKTLLATTFDRTKIATEISRSKVMTRGFEPVVGNAARNRVMIQPSPQNKVLTPDVKSAAPVMGASPVSDVLSPPKLQRKGDWTEVIRQGDQGFLKTPKDLEPALTLKVTDFIPTQLSLGSLYDGQTRRATLRIASPREGSVTASIPPKTPFRIVEIAAASGILDHIRLTAMKSGVVQPLVVQPVTDRKVYRRTKPPFTVSALAGQDILVIVEFVPKFDLFSGTPVGNHRTTLDISGNKWFASVPVSGRFEGIRIGVLPYLENSEITIVNTEFAQARCGYAVPQVLTLSNAEQTAHQVTISPENFPDQFSFNPMTVPLAPGETKKIPLTIKLHCISDYILVRYFYLPFKISYTNQERRTGFTVNVIPSHYAWKKKGELGSCDYHIELYILPNGYRDLFAAAFNNNLVFPRNFELSVFLTGGKIGEANFGMSGNSGKDLRYGLVLQPLADQYPSLFGQVPQYKMTCAKRGPF